MKSVTAISAITILNTVLQFLFQFLISMKVSNNFTLDLIISGMALYYFMLIITQSLPILTLTPTLIKIRNEKLKLRVFKTAFVRGALYYIIFLITLFLLDDYFLKYIFGFSKVHQLSLRQIFELSLVSIFISGVNGLLAALLQQRNRFGIIVGGILVVNVLQLVILMIQDSSIKYLDVPIIIIISQSTLLLIYLYFSKVLSTKLFWTLRSTKFTHKHIATVLGSTFLSKIDGLIDRSISSHMATGQLTTLHYSSLLIGSVANVSSKFLGFKSLNEFSALHSAKDKQILYKLFLSATIIGIVSCAIVGVFLLVFLDYLLSFLSFWGVSSHNLNFSHISDITLIMLPVVFFGLLNTILSNFLHSQRLHRSILILNLINLLSFTVVKILFVSKISLLFLAILLSLKSGIVFIGLAYIVWIVQRV